MLQNEIRFLGNWQFSGEGGTGYAGATFSKLGVCGTLNTMTGGNRMPMIVDIIKENPIKEFIKYE